MMAIEIERRFLVPSGRAAVADLAISSFCRIRQGYFGHINGKRVRVRVTYDAVGNQSATLSIKGPRLGARREEHEESLGIDDANRLLASLPPWQVIEKIRYYLWYQGSQWSIDNFEGSNAGLVIAEVELVDPGQVINLPPWIGEEITADDRYGNSTLARSPICIHHHTIPGIA